MKFSICIGKSKHEKNWKNIEITWEEFTNKLIKTVRTYETLEEYLLFSKEKQGEIKDVGGFISGHSINGRRLKDSILSKSMITLDIDNADEGFWDLCNLSFDFKMCLYTTHSHTVKNNRFRLIIPLSRELLKDEYEAVCRKIAYGINIDLFDPTSYQMNRLMYWPSTSKNGEYYFKQSDGNILDPDTILNEYSDWMDISQWPISKVESKIHKEHGKTQGNPLEKPGLIGLFNKTYTISEAIDKFLPDVYEKCGDSRFTFMGGSAFAGAIHYDDLFLYSHHSTDPACNQLCNAFDLVRIHKFGLEDHNIKEEVPINKRPSFLRMTDFASQDNKVKKLLGETRLIEAKAAFDIIPAEDWLELMDVDRKGNYLSTINNIALILLNDTPFRNNICYNEFEEVGMFNQDPPWRSIKYDNVITDSDLANLENYIEQTYKIKVSSSLTKALWVVFEKTRFHPVRDYLNSVQWDGVERIDNLLIDYLGAEDNDYTKTVTRKTLTAAVARIFEPGIKFDNILTTVGEEGEGKSALWDILGGSWFSDTFSMHMLQTKEGYEQIQGVWLIEIAELAGMQKADLERVKAFVSSRKDRYRPSYGKSVGRKPRQCIFVGSNNRRDFLRSQTGNRRFWPVATYINEPIKSVYSIASVERDLIWAEACKLYKAGETLFLNKAMIETAKEVQESYTEENPWVDIFKDYLEYLIPDNWYNLSRFDKLDFIQNYSVQKQENLVKRDKVCKFELWEIALGKKDPMDTFGLQNIKNTMRKIKNWEINNDLVRFGTCYPRHKGSYKLKKVIH